MMNKEQLGRQVANLALAIEELRDRADAEQRVTHDIGYSQYFSACLDILETELDAKMALLKRIQTVGR